MRRDGGGAVGVVRCRANFSLPRTARTSSSASRATPFRTSSRAMPTSPLRAASISAVLPPCARRVGESGKGGGADRRATERGAARDDRRRASRDGGGGGRSVSRRATRRRGGWEAGAIVPRWQSTLVSTANNLPSRPRRPLSIVVLLPCFSPVTTRDLSSSFGALGGHGGRRGGGLAERERRGGGVSARRTSRAAAFTSAPLSTRSCAMGAWPACAANLHRGWRVSHKEVGLFTTTRNRRSAVAHARRTNMSGVVQPTRLGLFITTSNRHLAVVRIRGERT